MKKKEFSYEIKEKICEIESDRDMIQVNLISYNGANPKYDLRRWGEDEDGNPKMLKGLTMTEEDFVELAHALSDWLENRKK